MTFGPVHLMGSHVYEEYLYLLECYVYYENSVMLIKDV